MSAQPKALLADCLDGNAKTPWKREEAAAELRRLHTQRDELLEALRIAREHIQIDRNSFKEACSFPDGFMEREDQSTLKQLDQKLAVIDAAIAKAEGGKE